MKKILIALLFAKSYEEKVGLSKEVKENFVLNETLTTCTAVLNMIDSRSNIEG